MIGSNYKEMDAYKRAKETEFIELVKERRKKTERISYLEGLLETYKQYEPYIKNHKEQWALRGYARKKYERQHIAELAYYDTYRNNLKSRIQGLDKRIMPKAWQRELDSLKTELQETQKLYADMAFKLARIEVLAYNRKEMERMLANESHQSKGEETLLRNKKGQSL